MWRYDMFGLQDFISEVWFNLADGPTYRNSEPPLFVLRYV